MFYVELQSVLLSVFTNYSRWVGYSHQNRHSHNELLRHVFSKALRYLIIQTCFFGNGTSNLFAICQRTYSNNEILNFVPYRCAYRAYRAYLSM